MRIPGIPQREFARPASAPATMPDLRAPDIGLPDQDHAGTTLARLGEPPEPGSPRAIRDLAITHDFVAQRTHAGDTWARAMDQHGGTAVWRELAAQAAGDQPTVQALVGSALVAASTQAGIGKRRWARPRPFQVDPGIQVIGRTPKGADSSYPSGHAARAYAAARVLASVDPTLADAAFAVAREVALSRIYAGVHFASDVVAGARLGIGLGNSVLERWRAGRLEGLPAPQGGSIVAA